MHELIYRLEERDYLQDEYILEHSEDTTDMFLLVNGSVEYITQIDGNDFVLKKLEKGAIINHTNVIIDDLMWVNIRCSSNVKMMILSNRNLTEVQAMFPTMKRKIDFAWSNIDRFGNKFPLDYIQNDQRK
jgi:CRP-like cAMP-binding protein